MLEIIVTVLLAGLLMLLAKKFLTNPVAEVPRYQPKKRSPKPEANEEEGETVHKFRPPKEAPPKERKLSGSESSCSFCHSTVDAIQYMWLGRKENGKKLGYKCGSCDDGRIYCADCAIGPEPDHYDYRGNWVEAKHNRPALGATCNGAACGRFFCLPCETKHEGWIIKRHTPKKHTRAELKGFGVADHLLDRALADQEKPVIEKHCDATCRPLDHGFTGDAESFMSGFDATEAERDGEVQVESLQRTLVETGKQKWSCSVCHKNKIKFLRIRVPWSYDKWGGSGVGFTCSSCCAEHEGDNPRPVLRCSECWWDTDCSACAGAHCGKVFCEPHCPDYHHSKGDGESFCTKSCARAGTKFERF